MYRDAGRTEIFASRPGRDEAGRCTFRPVRDGTQKILAGRDEENFDGPGRDGKKFGGTGRQKFAGRDEKNFDEAGRDEKKVRDGTKKNCVALWSFSLKKQEK